MSNEGYIPIKIELFGVASIEGHIIRYIAPLTADPILDKMPFVLRGRWSFGSKNYWTLPGVGLRVGINPKSTKDVEKGDIIFNPKTDELIIIVESMEMPNKINKIGKITSSNLDSIQDARNGLNTKVFKVK